MRAILHIGLFALTLTVVGQASADDGDRRRERRTTVVIAPKVEHRAVRPVRAPVDPMPPRYDYDYDYDREWKRRRHHRHPGVAEARREVFEQREDHAQIVRIAERWERATAERNPHAQRKAERRLDGWIEREIDESSRRRDNGRYVHRLHSLRRELRVSHAWQGRGHGQGHAYGYGYGRGRHRLNRHKANVIQELVELSEHELARTHARARRHIGLAFAYR